MIKLKTGSLKTKTADYAVRVLGFDDCRFTDLNLSASTVVYKKWLARGFHGEMAYLKKHLPFKENPRLLLPDARSAIVVIKNYKNTPVRRLAQRIKIARYAVGQDYHGVIGNNLLRLEKFLKNEDPKIQCYSAVDSRPVSERSLALKAGIGFLGKNAMVIKPGLGSYFFIGVILINHEFETDLPLKKDCGECRLCLDACPTDAIREGAAIDATKCLSYRTIERKSPLSDLEAKSTEGWVFGCDICQEVCPYNAGRGALTDWTELLPRAGVGFDFFDRLASGAVEKKIPKDSPLKRAGPRLWQNWRAMIEN